MWIKNLCIFQQADAFPFSYSQLHNALESNLCPEIGQQQQSVNGFVPVLKQSPELLLNVDNFWIGAWQESQRLLPASVINEELQQRVETLEAEKDRKIGRKEKAEIKDQLYFELLPRAFVRHRKLRFVVDMDNRQIWIESSAQNRAEAVVSALRKALGSLPVTPWSGSVHLPDVLSGFLENPNQLPQGFSLGDAAQLAGLGDEKPTIRFKSIPLDSDEVQNPLKQGLFANQIQLLAYDEIQFQINDKAQLKTIKPLSILQENLSQLDAEEAIAALTAEWSLQGGVLRKVVAALSDFLTVK